MGLADPEMMIGFAGIVIDNPAEMAGQALGVAPGRIQRLFDHDGLYLAGRSSVGQCKNPIQFSLDGV